MKLSVEREDVFENTEEDYFAEPVPEFAHSRNVPLVGFVIGNSGRLTWICQASRGRLAGTDLRRLNLENFLEVKETVTVQQVLDSSEPRFKQKLEERLNSGGLLPEKTFQELLRVLTELAPSLASRLSQYSEARRNRIGRIPDRARTILAEQKEAIATAMSLAGIERDELLDWDVSTDSGPTSFLDGLGRVRLREDPMVFNDSTKLPGFEAIKSTPFNSVVFENDRSRLTVLVTNRQPLEKELGVDLIYYNETFEAFLMVQYKAMEKEGDESVYRFPNEQLDDEVKRMTAVLKELEKCPRDDDADAYRLSENPFFLKLCPRIVFDPDNVGLVKGMYLPLGYWDLISKHKSMEGPKGGKRISYRNVRRYFDNTEFIMLAANAWVGSTISQSSELSMLIRTSLETGRSVVFAVAIDKDPRHHARS